MGAGLAVFITPTMPITGVGKIASPRVSLYRLTLPPVIGVSKNLQASAMPSIDSTSCAMISGRSGLPKFRLLVAATGSAPAVDRLRQHSATINLAPSRGSSRQYRALPSSVIAIDVPVSLIRTIAASEPGPSLVLVRTVWSYCCQIQRLEQMSPELSSAIRSDLIASPVARLGIAGAFIGT